MKERKKNDGQQKIYICASSLFRHASDTKTTQVVAIPGAKIGHIAHHVNNDTKMFEKAEILVIAAGSNMDCGTVEASKPYVEDQARELTQVIKPMAETKKVFIVDPHVGGLNKEEPAGHHWAMVHQWMKKVSKEAKATWISLEAVKWKPEEDVAEDGTHFTPAGTKKVLEVVGAKVMEVTGVDMMLGMEVEEKPYAGIFNGHYKFGCYRCTKVHERGRCPELNVSNNSPDNSPNSSGNNTIINSNDNNSDDNNSSDSNEEQASTSTPFEPGHRLSRSPPASTASPFLFRPKLGSEKAISGKTRIQIYAADQLQSANGREMMSNHSWGTPWRKSGSRHKTTGERLTVQKKYRLKALRNELVYLSLLYYFMQMGISGCW